MIKKHRCPGAFLFVSDAVFFADAVQHCDGGAVYAADDDES